ncbi:MAG: transketolase [Desulfobacterium sp. 4572_20]|nr:MAG: transketolase [Desulfobacterium sp. 4572_20]HDH87251.1 transketolase [Desulfobacteraceae bacterium]
MKELKMTSEKKRKSNEFPGSFESKCINTIRFLAVDAVQKANSGHPGMPMEASDLAYVLWTKIMRYNPKNPQWLNRDRFVLSAGHGSMLLYALLYLTGYNLTLDEIKAFRQWNSKTPGHPEYGCTPGVETTTGPLGQGFATGVGMAMAERFLANRFNRPDFPLVDYFIFSLVSDGDIMEGISSEAASLAGHIGLGNLIYIYLDNRITIEGPTDFALSEDVGRRFDAYNWQVQHVNGYDLTGIEESIQQAKGEKSKPSLIIARTNIAYGSPNKQDSADAHGAPLGEEEVALTKRHLQWPETPAFFVPEDVLLHFRQAEKRGQERENEWLSLWEAYKKSYPELAHEWENMHKEPDPSQWENSLPLFKPEDGAVATRSASGKVLQAVAPHLPGLIGGSADLAPSNNTFLKNFGEFKNTGGRNIHFGIREHAMGAILNGMALSGALIPYGGTFLVFSDYMRPAIRLAAMMGLPVIYVFTHDSIGLGEDGPTHQPIEQLSSLRAVPNLMVIRPADAQETVEAWKIALSRRDGPTALILTRQKLPIIDRDRYAKASELRRGAYILADAPESKPELILIGTGSEVPLLLSAYEQLLDQGIQVRVVNVPCWELFEMQSHEYHEKVLPSYVNARLAVEAGCPYGWERYTGTQGKIIGIERFGASAPGEELFQQFGFTVEHVIKDAKELLSSV